MMSWAGWLFNMMIFRNMRIDENQGWGGCKACIKHFALRLILYRNNYIPWNYARFLDYATERIFLQKVGGGYIFIHRMLMEHFAQMELDR